MCTHVHCNEHGSVESDLDAGFSLTPHYVMGHELGQSAAALIRSSRTLVPLSSIDLARMKINRTPALAVRAGQRRSGSLVLTEVNFRPRLAADVLIRPFESETIRQIDLLETFSMSEDESALRTRPSLLIRIRDGGDAESWRTFVTIYAPVVYRYACRRGLQDADAADVSQEVMGKVARDQDL